MMAFARWMNIRVIVVTLLITLILSHFLVHGDTDLIWIGLMVYSLATLPWSVEYGKQLRKLKLGSKPVSNSSNAYIDSDSDTFFEGDEDIHGP